MSKKRPAVCCFNCAHSKWPTDKAGRRMSNRAGTCTVECPPIPDCWLPMFRSELSKHHLYAEGGENCSAFKKREK